MVTVVQSVRASDCGSECRGFESHQSPSKSLQANACGDLFLCSPACLGRGIIGKGWFWRNYRFMSA